MSVHCKICPTPHSLLMRFFVCVPSTRLQERFPPVLLKIIKSFTVVWKRLLMVTHFASGACVGRGLCCYTLFYSVDGCAACMADSTRIYLSQHVNTGFSLITDTIPTIPWLSKVGTVVACPTTPLVSVSTPLIVPKLVRKAYTCESIL